MVSDKQRLAVIECIMSAKSGWLGTADARFLVERCRALEKALRRLAMKPNAVTAPHRHAHTMTPALDALYAAQLEAEALEAR